MQKFLGQYPPHQIHQLSELLVVVWDGHVHQTLLCVAQNNVGRLTSLCERLVISPGIGNHQKSQLPEGFQDLVSECPSCEVACNRSGSNDSPNFITASGPVFGEPVTLKSTELSMA